MAVSVTRACVLLLGIGLLASLGVAQEAPKTDADQSAVRKPSPSPAEKKPSLADLTRVSTDEAARSAAKDKAKTETSEGAAPETEESAVVELQTVKEKGETSGAVVTPSKKSKKSPLKDVHGSVYGRADARDAGSHREGAEVGASSKGGKTSIYVETERSRQTPPPR